MASACFPDEVFLLILDYMPKKRVLALAEISPTIDRIVFNSTRLKSKIQTKWNNFTYKPDEAWDEKTKMMKFLPYKHVRNVEEITFNVGYMEDIKFHSILRKHSRSLKKLVLNGVAFENITYINKYNMKCLEEIIIDRSTKDDVNYVLSLISAPNLRVFHYKDISMKHCLEKIENAARKIVAFVASSKQLQSLQLPWYCTEALVSLFSSSVSVEFKLERLELTSGWSLTSDGEKFLENFKTLLASQCDSLKELELTRFYLSEKTVDQILRMKNLKAFGSRYCELDYENLSRITNSSIETLSLGVNYGDEQTEASMCEILRCCQKIRKLKICCQEMTMEMTAIVNDKKLLDHQSIDRLKTLQLLRLYNKGEPLKMKWLSCMPLEIPAIAGIQKIPETIDSILKLRFKGTEVSGKAVLIEKLVSPNISFFKSTESCDEKMVFAVKSFRYLSADMIAAGLLDSKKVSTFKLTFIEHDIDKPIFIVHTRKDSSSILRFLETHHRAYGFYSLTWDVMRRFYDPTRRCRDCLAWGLFAYNCPFRSKCYKHHIYYDSNFKVPNPWINFKLLESPEERDAFFESDFPGYDNSIKQNMRLVSIMKAMLLPETKWDAVMRGFVEYFQYARIEIEFS